ncbi:MAG: thiol peroxidase [Micrococcus sp.]|nr:thiol peroxidase [Micrococcus sp.]
MASITFRSTPVSTVGELPAVGSTAPDFELVAQDLSALCREDLAGSTVVLNIFPSLDTGVCAASMREFNQRLTTDESTVVVSVSADLPFAAARFCSTEGIDRVRSGSTFRSSFGQDYGVTMQDGPLAGLLARAVVVIDAQGQVTYTELVPEIGQEPDYDAALAAARG